MKSKTQFDKILYWLLSDWTLSNIECSNKLYITGNSFHRILKEIERKFDIKLLKAQKGEGQKWYYEYKMKRSDIAMIREQLKI